jgi:ATP-dependent exoDNAse (exonuclease V) beta subunit
MKFLETVKLRVDEENTDLSAFLDFFGSAQSEQLYVHASGADAVKIMSIHKSKGLEFDCVILPFMEIRSDLGAGSRGAPYLVDPGEHAISLLRMNKSGIPFSERLERLYRNEYKRLLIDELNAMYVACTRAKKELYGFITPKSAASSNICLKLIPAEMEELGSENSYPAAGNTQEELIVPGPSEYRNWIPLLKEEFIEKSEVRNRSSILEGEAMHRALAAIGNLDGKTPAAEVAGRAVDSARPFFPLFDGWEELKKTLAKALADKKLSGVFSSPGARVRCEVEIVDTQGRFRRIDRLIETKDGIWIVDYKSSREEKDRGTQQLREYAGLVKMMLPAGHVRAFLLFMDTLELEEVRG